MRPSRAPVLGTITAGLVLSQAMLVPATAATVPWRPEAPPQGTGLWSNGCATPSTSGPTNVHSTLQDDDASAASTLSFVPGESASDVAWQYAPSSAEVGPVVTLPSTVTGFSVRARAASGTSSSGRLLVFYRPGASTTDYYVGEAAASASGDWATLDKSTGLLWWHHRKPGLITPEWSPVYTQGLLPPQPATRSLSTFVADKVTGGSLLAAYQLGCGGAFDIDHLTVTTGSGSSDYDLSNQTSRTTLTASATKVGAGGAVTLTGRVIGAFSGGTPAGGTVALQSRPYAATSFTTIATGSPGQRFTVTPGGTTSYRLQYSGSPAATASTSGTATVQVAARISARLASTRVVRGGSVTLVGKVAPATAGVPVSLQRQVGKTWRTLAKTRSVTGGTYQVSTKATSSGAWAVRAVAGSVRGNLSGTSPVRHLTVRTKTRVTLALSRTSVLPGTRYTVHGTARPHKKGVRVTLQRRVGTKWVKVTTKRTSAKGTFTFKRRAGAPGTTVYRVVVAAWGLNTTGVSPTRKIVVHPRTPPPPPPPTGGTGDGGGTGIGGGGGTGIG
jgi:hypothetical protein